MCAFVCRQLSAAAITVMRVELAGRVLATAIVVACLSASGDTYVLPDDLVPPTFRPTHQHHHHRQQQQPGEATVTHDELADLSVTVKPQYTVMHLGKPVHINCTATASKEQPFISFFVSPSVRVYN